MRDGFRGSEEMRVNLDAIAVVRASRRASHEGLRLEQYW